MTRLPRSSCVARYLGGEGEAARDYFARPVAAVAAAVAGREAAMPRIWGT